MLYGPKSNGYSLDASVGFKTRLLCSGTSFMLTIVTCKPGNPSGWRRKVVGRGTERKILYAHPSQPANSLRFSASRCVVFCIVGNNLLHQQLSATKMFIIMVYQCDS